MCRNPKEPVAYWRHVNILDLLACKNYVHIEIYNHKTEN